MNQLIERLMGLEKDIHYRKVPEEGEFEFSYIPGTIPVLVSAPHGAGHHRNGRFKEEDEFTGGLARLIGEETGAHVLYAHNQSNTDPNSDFEAPYKYKLAEIVKQNGIAFIFDLHGTKESSDCGIELGTARGFSCTMEELELILITLQEFGFSKDNCGSLRGLWVDQKNAGVGTENEERVIGFAWKRLGISAVQVEINAYLRTPERRMDDARGKEPFWGHPELIVSTILALCEAVRRMDRRIQTSHSHDGGGKAEDP